MFFDKNSPEKLKLKIKINNFIYGVIDFYNLADKPTI